MNDGYNPLASHVQLVEAADDLRYRQEFHDRAGPSDQDAPFHLHLPLVACADDDHLGQASARGPINWSNSSADILYTLLPRIPGCPLACTTTNTAMAPMMVALIADQKSILDFRCSSI